MIYFLDATILVKRYVDEEGSKAVRVFLRRRRRIAVSRLSMVEMGSALWRRAREGSLSVDHARRSTVALARDLSDFDLVEVRAGVIGLAATLVARHPLRAYDAVQLASALWLSQETGLALAFASTDDKLAEAARLEGLRVVNISGRPARRSIAD